MTKQHCGSLTALLKEQYLKSNPKWNTRANQRFKKCCPTTKCLPSTAMGNINTKTFSHKCVQEIDYWIKKTCTKTFVMIWIITKVRQSTFWYFLWYCRFKRQGVYFLEFEINAWCHFDLKANNIYWIKKITLFQGQLKPTALTFSRCSCVNSLTLETRKHNIH